MNGFTISLVKPEDVEEIRNIQKETWLTTYPNQKYGITKEAIQKQFDNKEKTKEWIRGVKQAVSSGESFGWYVKINGQIVGYSFAKKMKDKNRIMSLYVLSTYQKKGIGKALMTTMLSWVDNTKPTVLEVASYNTNAIAFYKSFGFAENGPTQNEAAAVQTGIVIPEIEMIKRQK